MTLVDTCVLLDVVGNDPVWADWSQMRLEHAASHGGILINPVIHAEFSVGFEDIAQVEQTLAGFSARMKAVPREAAISGGQGISSIPCTRRYPCQRAAEFLHQRGRGRTGAAGADARCAPHATILPYPGTVFPSHCTMN